MTQPTVPFWVIAFLVVISAGESYAIVNAAMVHLSDTILYALGIVQVMTAALMGVLNIAKANGNGGTKP